MDMPCVVRWVMRNVTALSCAVLFITPLLPVRGQVLEAPDCRASGSVVPYTPLREADVMWERRVWRVLDATDARNRPLFTPLGELPGCLDLFEVIRHGLRDEGGLLAYDPGPLAEDDAFHRPFDKSSLLTMLSGLDSLPLAAVSRYMIKEDWIFDRARSMMDVRIIGIAPMIEVRGADGELRGHRPLFWLYYPECRHLFAWWTAITLADGERVSYEQFFGQRRFHGSIVKVSGMQGQAIARSATGSDAFLRGAALEDQLLRMGFDLWNY